MDINLIKFAPIFAGLAESEQRLLAEKFLPDEYAENDAIFTAGESSDALYLLSQGFARLATESGHNLATLGPGSVLGEASLFRNAIQDISAIAVSQVECWRLSDRSLRDLVLQQPSIGIKLSQNFGDLLAQMEDYLVARLGSTEELGTLPPHTLQALAGQLQTQILAAGQPLYQSGDTPEGLFLVESGSLDLRPETSVANEDPQATSSGEILGALALLTNKPYTHDAIAREDTLLWFISESDFQQINSRHPGLRRSLGRKVRARLSKADQTQAIMRMAQMPLFAELSNETMQVIAQHMALQHVSAGERVYRIGESGDSLYLIESGEIELTAENTSGVIEELARISSGGYFGDMSLLTGQIRTEDATATRNTNLWVVYKSELDKLSAQYPDIGTALNQGLATRLSSEKQGDEERFRAFPLLANLSDADFKQVIQCLHPTRFRQGEQIALASTPADMLYLIENGEVRIQTFNGGSWILGPGESFGERALLTGQSHSASVMAETDVDLWGLGKADFDILLNRCPGLAINLSRVLSQRLGESNSYMAPPQEHASQPSVYAPPATIPHQTTSLTTQRRQAIADETMTEPRQRVGFGRWFGSLSGFAKVRLALVILLLIYLIFVAAPMAFLSLLNGANIASGASLPFSSSSALAAVYSMGSYEVSMGDRDRALAVAMADRQVGPTATYTPPPTNTPVPSSTLLPTSTATPVPPTNTPAFVQRVAALAPAAPVEAEPEVQVPSLPPRAWDPRLDRLGVNVQEAPVSGQPYWRLIEAKWWDEQEAGGKHHIYVEVLDENGQRIVGHPVQIRWDGGEYTGNTEDKAFPDYAFNYQMYAAGQAYRVQVVGGSGDIITGLGMGDIERRTWGIHTTFLLTYQRIIAP